MKAHARPLSSDWHRVGSGLAVRFSMASEGELQAEWLPRKPRNRREFLRVQDRYRIARDAFATALAQERGYNIIVLEI